MEGQSLFIGFTASTSNRFCPLCGGPVEARDLLTLVTLVDRPRACCGNCARVLSPSLSEVLNTIKGKASPTMTDLLDMRPGPDGLTLVREYLRLVEHETFEPEEIEVEWVSVSQVAGE